VVDSRAKGARGEYLVRDLLREHTGLQFERVPSSGALEYLKGDLYVPHEKNKYCIEVKNYSESPLTDKIFTAPRTNNLIRWWNKVVQQAHQGNQEPLLFFKYNRSKVFIVVANKPKEVDYMYVSFLGCYAALAEDWLLNEEYEFLHETKITKK
jgi:Holliday junction resolvase